MGLFQSRLKMKLKRIHPSHYFSWLAKQFFYPQVSEQSHVTGITIHRILTFSVIWTGKLLELKLLNSFCDELASPSRWMALSFRRKGSENWACPSNQHKQSLKPLFSKIPHEREMSLAKKLVWRELTECYTQATEQTGFWTWQKGHKLLIIKYEMCMHKKKKEVKWYICASTPSLLM